MYVCVCVCVCARACVCARICVCWNGGTRLEKAASRLRVTTPSQVRLQTTPKLISGALTFGRCLLKLKAVQGLEKVAGSAYEKKDLRRSNEHNARLVSL